MVITFTVGVFIFQRGNGSEVPGDLRMSDTGTLEGQGERWRNMENYDPENVQKVKKFIKKAKQSGIIIAAIIVIPVLGLSSVYKVQEQEQAVLTTFGVATPVTTAGLHFKIPFIQRVTKVNTTIQGFALGYDPNNNESQEADSLMITKDYNFVNVDFFVEYKVSDPVKAVYASEDPVLVLKNVSQSCIRNVIGSYEVDAVLTTGKNEIQSKIKDMVVQQLENHDIGIQVINITIQDAEPPTAMVMEAFKAVETAKQGKETAINNANKYRNEKLPEATAEVDKIMQEAESTKAKRINEATAEVSRFNAMYAEYAKNQDMTKKRMFYEAMEDILPNMKVIIDGTDQTNTILPLDSFVQNSGSQGDQGSAPESGTAGQAEAKNTDTSTASKQEPDSQSTNEEIEEEQS